MSRTKAAWLVLATLVAGTAQAQTVQPTSGSRPSGTVTISPSTVDLGDVEIGTSRSTSLTVTNTTRNVVPVNVSAIGPWSRGTGPGECGTSVAAGKSCRVSLAFKPTSAEQSTISVSAAPASATVTGRGIAGQPKITVTPTRLNLECGRVSVSSARSGSPTTQPVTVRNIGRGSLKVLSATTASPFSATVGTCAAVPANGSCSIAVTYTPVSKDRASGTLNIASNGGNATVTLSGSCPGFVSAP